MARTTKTLRGKIRKSSYVSKRALRRSEILSTSAKLFSLKSYHDVTMEEVARKVGVSKGTIYLYFESKENLYLEILENAFDSLVSLIEVELAKEYAAPKKLLEVLKLIFGYYRKHTDVLRILSRDETHLIREHYEMTERWRKRGLQLYEKIIEKGIREGSFRATNSKLTALIIYALVRSITFYYTTKKKPGEVAEEVYSVIVNGILNPAKKTMTA
ncbi:MAG: TetR/AcrR family transcriptional regulator [Thermodesulfobacteriota bacterium]